MAMLDKIGKLKSISGTTTFFAKIPTDKGEISDLFFRLQEGIWIRLEKLNNGDYYCPQTEFSYPKTITESAVDKLKKQIKIIVNKPIP